MKKNGFLLVTLLFLGGLTAQAQLKIGVKAGVNLSKVSFSGADMPDDWDSVVENLTGFQVGPILELTAPYGGFGFDIALLYSQQGFKTKNIKEDYKTGTLEIPLNLKGKLKFSDNFGGYITAGPYAGFVLSNNLGEQFKSKTFGAGLNLGAGFELLSHFQIGVNYKLGLTDDFGRDLIIVKDENDPGHKAAFNGKQRVWSVSAALFF
jgi:hypothetical protein